MPVINGPANRADTSRPGNTGQVGASERASSGAAADLIPLPPRILSKMKRRPATTAVLLAAGIGSRLQAVSQGLPKCLTEVAGTPILGRLLSGLVEQGFKRLVVVVGYESDQVRDYLEAADTGLDIQCIYNPRYATANNIYSLWLVKEHVQEPFVLIESDLVVDSGLLGLMRVSNRIALARFRPEMNGTTVSIYDSGLVESFSVGGFGKPHLPYKTVNMYSLSPQVWREAWRRLDQRVSAGLVDDYYEIVFADMADDGLLPLRAVRFDHGRWSEIDTPDDLLVAEHQLSVPASL
ncbi:MAG: NTP transferase domain-containing protein [Acidimicrobiales bacterium]